MKRHGSFYLTLIWWLSATLQFAALGAEGVVLNERVNVRTRPSIASEVIHQLNTGDKVTILDRINLNDPQPNEPKDWFRIKIPSSTELWISSEYLDTNNQVQASRLNVRAGPGQNFSVVGRIERGTTVQPIRVSAGWTAIQPLDATVAYVASEFLRESSTAQAAEIIEPETSPEPIAEISAEGEIPELIVDESTQTAPSPVSPAPARTIVPVQESRPTQTPVVSPPPSVTSEESLFDRIESSKPAEAIATPPDFEFTPIEPIIDSTDIVTPSPEPVISEELATELKRVITRDGIVKRSRNIQAPTYHRLDDPRTGTTINYLYTGKLQVDLGTGPRALKPYEGRKIRVVGTEAVDARWPRIPVIEVEQLRILE